MRKLPVTQKLCLAILFVVLPALANAQGNPLSDLPQPGTVYTNQNFGTSPSMTVFNSEIWIAYKSNSNAALMLTSSSDGVTFSAPFVPNSVLSALDSGTSPALAVFSGQLYISFVNGGTVYITSTSNGTTFTAAAQAINVGTGAAISASSSPTLASYNGELWLAVVQNGSNSATSVADFETVNPASGFISMNVCSGGSGAPNGEMPQTGAAVGMAALGSQLWFGYQTQGGHLNHNLLLCEWTGTAAYYDIPQNSGVPYQVGSGVSAVAYNNAVYFNYKAYSSHDLQITEEYSLGSSSTNAGYYSDIQINGNSEINPSETIFNGRYYLSYTQNNSGHDMYLTHD